MTIAVVLRDRVEEGLRMSVGLTLSDDKVRVYFTAPVAEPSASATEYLEALGMMGAEVFSPSSGKDASQMALEAVACDRVIVY